MRPERATLTDGSGVVERATLHRRMQGAVLPLGPRMSQRERQMAEADEAEAAGDALRAKLIRRLVYLADAEAADRRGRPTLAATFRAFAEKV